MRAASEQRRSPAPEHRRARSDSGASAVEFALILPLFLILVFGTISAGFGFERWINVTQAARETSRFAATYPVPVTGMNDWFTKINSVAVEAAGIDTTKPSSYFICIRFVNDAGPALTPATEMRTYGTLSTAGSSCTGSTNNGDNRVEVVIQRSIDFNLLIAPPNVTIPVTGDNTTRFEPRLT
jgi:Flp pilus assembly protein TadG